MVSNTVMKRLITLIALITIAFAANAQDKNEASKAKNCSEKTSFECEHIAYLTKEMDLTVDEAQVFWPIYNRFAKEQRESFKEYKKKMKAMILAVRENIPEDELEVIMKEVLDLKLQQKDVFAEHAEEIKKAIGPVKAAKFYIAEETFRNWQMRKLCGKTGSSDKSSTSEKKD